MFSEDFCGYNNNFPYAMMGPEFALFICHSPTTWTHQQFEVEKHLSSSIHLCWETLSLGFC